MEFHNFIAVFKGIVENEVTGPREQLSCLIKFLKRKIQRDSK